MYSYAAFRRSYLFCNILFMVTAICGDAYKALKTSFEQYLELYGSASNTDQFPILHFGI